MQDSADQMNSRSPTSIIGVDDVGLHIDGVMLTDRLTNGVYSCNWLTDDVFLYSVMFFK